MAKGKKPSENGGDLPADKWVHDAQRSMRSDIEAKKGCTEGKEHNWIKKDGKVVCSRCGKKKFDE